LGTDKKRRRIEEMIVKFTDINGYRLAELDFPSSVLVQLVQESLLPATTIDLETGKISLMALHNLLSKDVIGEEVEEEKEEYKWVEEWPTKPGAYWFHGWEYGNDPGKPELLYVIVVKDNKNRINYSTASRPIFQEEGAHGVWKEVDCFGEPALPTRGRYKTC